MFFRSNVRVIQIMSNRHGTLERTSSQMEQYTWHACRVPMVHQP